jgi:SAM-dependent methyltransferase
MNPPSSVSRTGEYAERGDYHRNPSTDWEFYPTYIAKLTAVRSYLAALPSDTRVLDAGCGEGVLVEEFRSRLAIVGADPNYSSEFVTTASLLKLPYADGSFDRALCLDVLEHLPYPDQALALAELYRVVRSGGELLISVPNLAHLQSRIHFLLAGRLIHTASLAKHPGDRPIGEFLELATRTGFQGDRAPRNFPDGADPDAMDQEIARAAGVVAPVADAGPPRAGWCFLNIVRFARP